MSVNPILYCPIRGQLHIKAKTKDGLKFTEEKRRIDCIKFLLDKGYPPKNFKIESTLIQFGHAGKNSFRTDLVVFKVPASEVKDLDLEKQRELIMVLAEIKRDHEDAVVAKATQVKPAMYFVPDFKSLGIYWDDVEQSVYYKEVKATKQIVLEAPITYFPDYGAGLEVKKLRYHDLQVTNSLVGLFKNMEDTLHPYIADLSLRYELLLQLLLVKVYDEGANKQKDGVMTIQDYSLFDVTDASLIGIFNDSLTNSLNIYQKYLPNEVSTHFNVSGSAIRQVTKYLAPIKLLESGPEVMQDFYMYFAKQLYKWDLAQYFTPYEVVDFIVRITNPQYGDTVKDPACGSADFLISAYRRGLKYDAKMGEKIFGADNSVNAVQISVLNMMLNGDGKSNIDNEDSLFELNKYTSMYSIMLCNPPFGVRITEKRSSVLSKFDLGKGLKSQQTGILFAELCIRQAKPGGRIAVIVPNGYLGNRSANYVNFRKWILIHTKIACVISFPRFTFKKSGADVSASVLVLEKRAKPLEVPEKSEEYPFYVNTLQSVGWEIGNKGAEPIFQRDLSNGALILNTDNEPVLDAEFESVFKDLYSSPVSSAFPWIRKDVSMLDNGDGWSVQIHKVLTDKDYLLDPKRLCRKYLELTEAIKSYKHESLLDICDVIPEGWKGKITSSLYHYVELTDVHENSYEYHDLRGWELPSRAKHKAEPGDIFIGAVWGSVSKWFMAGNEAKENNIIVTNGFNRLHVKPGKEHLLPELLFALSSEYYAVQMRALATGSDGLAEVSPPDLALILIPVINDESLRTSIKKYIDELLDGTVFIRPMLSNSLKHVFPQLNIPPRKTHFSQV